MLRILGSQLGEFLGTSHHFFQRGVVELVDRGGAGFLAIAGGHRQRHVADFTRGGDAVASVADVALVRAGQIALALVRFREGEHLGQQFLRLLFVHDCHFYFNS